MPESIKDNETFDSDEAQLRAFGYTQTLHRTWHQFENFAASFCALYFVGGIRFLYSVGVSAGGPPALWSSWFVTVILMCITAATLAEVCSSIPLSGSIYVWGAECAGIRWGRLAGFVVAFWTITAWTSFAAGSCQGIANYMLSEIVVFNLDFPGGVDTANIKFRAVQWACAIAFLWIVIGLNMLSPRAYRAVFWLTFSIIMLDYFLTLIWLPVGVSKTYGFQSGSFFTTYYNGTNAPTGWNWCLSFLFTSGVLTGFDAAGHVAEETKNASLTAARGIFWSCVASGVLGTPIVFLFLVCSPPIDTLYSFTAPQPFVQIYAAALGQGGHVVMNIVAIFGLLFSTTICILASSRLVFAVARDGVLPGSSWIGKVDKDGAPRNSVIFIGIVASVLLCTILASPVAFTSLISAGAIPTIAAYALISALRLFVTPGQLKVAKWSNGIFSKPFLWISMIWNLFVMATLISPYYFEPDGTVTAQDFNYAPVILGGVTIMAFVAYLLTPEHVWLDRRRLKLISENEAYSKEKQ